MQTHFLHSGTTLLDNNSHTSIRFSVQVSNRQHHAQIKCTVIYVDLYVHNYMHGCDS